MSIYIIGDVQGCYDELQALLDKINFDPADDRLWFAGDLVNRGPKSLKVLRFVRSLGNSALTVLGNHDLHLLAIYHGIRTDGRHTLDKVVNARDSDEIIDWLRHQPLLHYDKKLNVCLVHAGLAPQWTLKRARKCAAELEQVLRSDDYVDFLKAMYGDKPDKWDQKLEGEERLRFICNCFTRIRYINKKGSLALDLKGSPDEQTKKYIPWFEFAKRPSKDTTIVIGHWSALGAYKGDGIYATDTGCIWGGKLSALQIDTGKPRFHKVGCKD